MAFPLKEVIDAALQLSKELINQAGEIIQSNQEIIKEIDQRDYELACECVNSYKKEILIIESQIKTEGLPEEVVNRYLDRISEINENIKSFVNEWTNKSNLHKEKQTNENQAVMLGALGLLTGGLGLIPYGIIKRSSKKK